MMRGAKGIAALLVVLGVMVGRLEAATLTVCASGCTYTQATLGTALTTAVDGDVITLKAGETFTGHWTLPNKGVLTTGITIRSDTADANLPGTGVRTNPTYAAFMPTVRSDTTSNPVFTAAAGANGYRFLGIRFYSNPFGYGSVLLLGSNNCDASFCQEFASQEPSNMTVDRCIFNVDPKTGQKVGISIGGKNLTIINNYMEGFAGLGQDSQPINGSNGHGPVRIENNYLEGSTENFMLGGDDPRIRTVMTVTGSPTTSSASVSVTAGPFGATHNLSELVVGSHIAIATSGGTQRRHTTLRSVTGTGTTGSITFDPISEVPDVPGDIRWQVQLDNVTIKRNHLTKPLRWLNPIIANPTTATATPSTASGSLAAGTYTYTVVAINVDSYTENDVFSNPTVTSSAVLSGTGRVTVSWSAVPDATHYRIYGRSGTVSTYWTVTAPTLTYVDDGTAGTAATSVVKASYWQIKNLGEIKAASNVVISGNVFEYGWTGSDAGYTGMWIKTANQNGGGEGLQTRDVVVENNIFRHINGWLVINGEEFYTGNNVDKPGPITNLTVRNNLVTDCSAAWALSKGTTVTAAYALTMGNHSVNTTIDHNTINCTSRGLIFLNGTPHDNFKFTNNMALKNSNGIFGDAFGQGTAGIAGRTTSYTVTANAIGGISTGSYPAGNFGPTVTDWQNEFNNYTADAAPDADGPADYSLRSDSTYISAGTDGLPLGANISAINAATAGVVEGAPGSSPVPPTITTTSPLPAGSVGTAYSNTLQALGTGTLTWALQTGTLPTGLSLSSAGIISGTPTTAQSRTFTVRVTDAGTSLTADQSLSLTINSSYTAPNITTTTLTNATLSTPYSVTLAVTGGLGPFSWNLSAGSLPAGLTLTPGTGVIAGTPSATGVSTFTAQVTDSLGGTDTQALTLTVNQVTLPCGRPQRFQQQEALIFRRPTPPATTSPDCAALNDLWINTSVNPAVVNLVSGVSGASVTTTPVGVSPNLTGHALLSATHTDTVTDTAQDGDIIIGNSNTGWQKLSLGAAGTYLKSSGSSIDWGALTLPDTTNVTARINAPIHGVDNYVAFSPVTSPGCSSGNFGRMFYDSADNTLKVCQGAGGSPTAIGSGGSARSVNIMFHTRPASSTQFANLPAALTELWATTGNRVPIDLTGYTQARFYMKVFQEATATTASCAVQYSTDNTTFNYLDGASGPSVPIITAGAHQLSSWVTITPAARADVWLRVVCINGDGVVDPTFGNISMTVK